MADIMYENKRFLAIIPARSGSKGMKDKNISLLHGKPMMAYSIEAAQESGIFDEIFLSTDSQHYADIALKYGASVPSLRPDYLSSDTATSVDTVLYTLDLLEKQGNTFDFFMLLQPTSPLRTAEHIKKAVEECMAKEADSMVSFCPCEHPPEWSCKEQYLGDLTGFYATLQDAPRQKVEPSYRLNGSIFLSNVSTFRQCNHFYSGKSVAFLMDACVSVDVDGKEDFEYVEYLMEKNI